MINKLKENKNTIIVYAIIILLLFLQHNVVCMYFDDFGNASLSYAHTIPNVAGTNFTFAQLLEAAGHTYLHYGGRILYGMIASLLLKNGIKPFMMLQVFVITGIIYCICEIITILTKKKSIIYPILCMILYMLFDISILRHGIYWASASVLYVWPLLPFFASILLYLKTIQKVKDNEKVSYIKYFLFSTLYIIFSVFSQEQIGVAYLVFLFFYIVFDHIKEWKKYLKYDIYPFILGIATYLVLFLAPGNWERMGLETNAGFANQSFFGKIYMNLPKIIELFFKAKTSIYINIFVSILLIFLVSFFIKNYKKNKYYFLLVFPILGMAVNYILFEKQYYHYVWFTTLVGIGILCSMFIALLVYYIHKKELPILSLSLAAVCSVFCLLMAPYTVERSVIPCVFMMFIPIIMIGMDMFSKNTTTKTLIILLVIICTYFGLDNAIHVYIGYRNNYEIHQENYEKLVNYEKYEENNTVKLCKVKYENHSYGSTQPYEFGNYYWIQQYFDLPTDLELEWDDCYDTED